MRVFLNRGRILGLLFQWSGGPTRSLTQGVFLRLFCNIDIFFFQPIRSTFSFSVFHFNSSFIHVEFLLKKQTYIKGLESCLVKIYKIMIITKWCRLLTHPWPFNCRDELSRLENLTFLWTWLLRWVIPRSFAIHASLFNFAFFLCLKPVKILAVKGLKIERLLSFSFLWKA